jgi:hypothetical protein
MHIPGQKGSPNASEEKTAVRVGHVSRQPCIGTIVISTLSDQPGKCSEFSSTDIEAQFSLILCRKADCPIRCTYSRFRENVGSVCLIDARVGFAG